MHLLHLLRADIRRFGFLLAGWVLVQAMSALYEGLSPFIATDGQMAVLVAVLGFVLTLARWLGLAAMVPLLLQTHPAVGSDAFWLTRPIPWTTLLLSKIVLIGALFVGLPMLFEAILMAAFRVPLRDIGLVSVQNMLLQALLVALLLALAALTQSLARFALVAGGLLLSFAVLINIGLIVAMRLIDRAPQINEVAARLESSSSLPAILLLISFTAALALLIAVQYRSRSTGAAISAGVAGIALAVALQFVWPWSYRVLAAPAWTDRESALRLVVPAPRIEFSQHDEWSSNQPSEWLAGALRLRATGVEKTWVATLRLVESSLQFEDGSSLPTVGNGFGMPVPLEGVDDLPDNAGTREVLGVSRLWPVRWDERQAMDSARVIVLREADVRKRLGTAATYRGRFMVDLDQLQVVGTLPLQSGAEFHDAGFRVVLERAVLLGSSAQVRVRRITTTSLFDPGERPWLHFYLRNARTSEAIAGFDRPDYARTLGVGMLMLGGASAASTGSLGFDVRRQRINFSGYAQPDRQGFEITPDWLSQSELAIVRRVGHGSVTRTLEIPRVEIVDSPRRTTAR